MGNNPTVTVSHSVYSSYSGNETSLISDERTYSKTQSGYEDDFIELNTKLTFEDCVGEEAGVRSSLVQVSSYRGKAGSFF